MLVTKSDFLVALPWVSKLFYDIRQNLIKLDMGKNFMVDYDTVIKSFRLNEFLIIQK